MLIQKVFEATILYVNFKYTLRVQHILWLLHAEVIISLAFKVPCWFSEVPSFFYDIIFNPCSICTRTLYSCEEPAFNGYCTRSHICPQTGNVDSPHIMADSSLESLITAQNKGKHVLAYFHFSKLPEGACPQSSQAELLPTAMPSRVARR